MMAKGMCRGCKNLAFAIIHIADSQNRGVVSDESTTASSVQGHGVVGIRACVILAAEVGAKIIGPQIHACMRVGRAGTERVQAADCESSVDVLAQPVEVHACCLRVIFFCQWADV